MAGGKGRVGLRARGAVRMLRRRVRLRTRLRRARDAWRQRLPRRLPEWSDRPGPAAAPVAGSLQLTVESPGELRRYAAGVDPAATIGSLELAVTGWRTPYRDWSGRLGPLPGLLHQQVRLPPEGRGRATVSVGLARPLPVPRVIEAARQVLEAGPRPAVIPDQDVPGAGAPWISADPRGRHRYGSRLPAGRLRLAGGAGGPVRWEIAAGAAATVVGGRDGEPLDDRQRAVLAELGTVRLDGELAGAAHGQVLLQLATTGVPLHAPGVSGRWLAPELAGLLREPLPGPDADPMEWEIRSVRQRRAAMRLAGWSGPGASRPPLVSALLVTKRPHRIVPALQALQAQTYPELEIVVGVHGGELPPAVREQLAGPVVAIPPERNLGEALAEATRAARGTLVTKVDDDDRYGPEHVWDVVLAWHYSGAAIAGKGADFVWVEPQDRTVRRRMGAECYADTVAGGTLTLARSDLAAVGGWPPVRRWVDRALLDRVLAAGGLVYCTHPLGFIYTRHAEGHTWEADLDYFLLDPQRSWRGLPPYPEFGTR